MILRSSNRTSRGHRPAGGRLGAGLRRRAVCAAAAAACLFAAAFTGGCTRDLTDSGDFGPNPAPSGDYATLRLVVPGVSTAGTYAAEVAQETLLEAGKLHVLLYAKNNEGNWQFVSVTTPEAEDISEAEVAENGDGSATYDIHIPFPAGNTDRTFRAGLVSGLTLDELKAHYRRGGLGDVKVKKFLIAVLNETLEPIRERRKQYEGRIEEVYEILRKGSEHARATAAQTLGEVRHAMRIDYFDDKELIAEQARQYQQQR